MKDTQRDGIVSNAGLQQAEGLTEHAKKKNLNPEQQKLHQQHGSLHLPPENR